MNQPLFLTFIFIVWSSFSGLFGQDTILKNNGREVVGRFLKIDSTTLHYISVKCTRTLNSKHVKTLNDTSLVYKKDTLFGYTVGTAKKGIRFSEFKKERHVYRGSYFGRYGQHGKQQFYQQDTLARGFDLAEADMEAYVYGRRSARRYYKGNWAYGAGAAAGLAGIPFQYIIAPLPAIVYSAVLFSIRPKVKKTGPEDKPYLQNPYFIDGYRTQANKIKMKKSLITSIPGIGIALTINYLFIK